MNVEMALEISKLIHDECDNVSHDIGMRIVAEIVEKYENEELREKETLIAELSDGVSYGFDMSIRYLDKACELNARDRKYLRAFTEAKAGIKELKEELVK
jgi:hypothetical protein